jgi:hypothetical protein
MFEAYVKKNAGNFLLAVALWVCPSSYGSNLPEPKAEALLRQMTPEEQVGQLVQVSSAGSLTGPDDAPTLRRAEFEPGTPWPASDGVHVNAHGGNIVFHEGLYYWYGSHKIEGRTESQTNEAGVRCYTSKDLYNWENAGMVLSKETDRMHAEVADAGILDRPKVAFNDTTGVLCFISNSTRRRPKAGIQEPGWVMSVWRKAKVRSVLLNTAAVFSLRTAMKVRGTSRSSKKTGAFITSPSVSRINGSIAVV